MYLGILVLQAKTKRFKLETLLWWMPGICLIRASCVRSTSRVYVRYFVVMQIAMRMWVVTECPSLLLMLSRSPQNELILIKSIITVF